MGWLIQILDNSSPGVNENDITYTSMPSFVKADTDRPASHSTCWRRLHSVGFFTSRRFIEWRAIFELWIKQGVEESKPGLIQGVYCLRIWQNRGNIWLVDGRDITRQAATSYPRAVDVGFVVDSVAVGRLFWKSIIIFLLSILCGVFTVCATCHVIWHV